MRRWAASRSSNNCSRLLRSIEASFNARGHSILNHIASGGAAQPGVKIEFLMCGEATEAFWSQAAIFRCRLNALGEPYASARQVLCLGVSEEAHRVPSRWTKWFGDIEVHWADSKEAEDCMLYRAADPSSDVSILCDADTLLMDVLPESFLRDCVQKPAIRGVVAHYPPPLRRRDGSTYPLVTTPSDMWTTLSDRILGRPITMVHSYTLVNGADDMCPFYINHGFVAAQSALMVEFGRLLPDVLATVRTVIDNHFCYQIAIPFVVERASLPYEALPMRYNFPNDPVCDRMYPEELKRVLVMHYLRTDLFDRHVIFAEEREFDRFMNLSLTGSNQVFQTGVRALTDGVYPFAAR
jgi:hypothetical protein